MNASKLGQPKAPFAMSLRTIIALFYATVFSAAEPALKLQVTPSPKVVAVGEDVTLDIVLSTEGPESHTFLLGSFAQIFGVYVLGPWGIVQPDTTKVRSENWMHQEHSAAAKITVTKDSPYRATIKLSDYFRVRDADAFKMGRYQINFKFYESSWNMSAPIDSGTVLVELVVKK